MHRLAPLVLVLALAACDTGGPTAPAEALEPLWRLDSPALAGGQVAPLVLGDSVAVAALGVNLAAVRVATGEVKWQTRVSDEYALQTASIVTDGRRAFTSQHLAADKRVMAFDLETGALVWERTPEPGGLLPLRTAPHFAAGDGRFFYTTAAGQVAALDGATGRTIWSVEADSVTFRAATYADGRVYLARGGRGAADDYVGFVTVLDAATGDEVWSTYDEGGFSTPVLVDGDAVYAVSDRVLRLDRETGEVVWAADPPGDLGWPMIGHLDHDATSIYGSGNPWKVDKATGRVAWQAPGFVGGGGYNVVERGGRVYHARGDVYVLDAGTGATVQTAGSPGYTTHVVEAGDVLLTQSGSLAAYRVRD